MSAALLPPLESVTYLLLFEAVIIVILVYLDYNKDGSERVEMKGFLEIAFQHFKLFPIYLYIC